MFQNNAVQIHRLVWTVAAYLFAQISVVQAQTDAKRRGTNLAPFVPTPMPIVDQMLALAEVTKDDVVYDLGCGDGRIVVAAAQKYGAKGVGIDYDPERIAEANVRAREHEVQKLVEFIEQDAMTVDISSATVVTLYLLAESNRKLKPRLENLLPPGTRVVANKFIVPGWTPIRDVPVNQSGPHQHHIYLYRTPGGETLSGSWWWTERREGDEQEVKLQLREDGGRIAGVLVGPDGAKAMPVKSVTRVGNNVTVKVETESDDRASPLIFSGALLGDRIAGEVTTADDAPPRVWKARRKAVNVDGTWCASQKSHPDEKLRLGAFTRASAFDAASSAATLVPVRTYIKVTGLGAVHGSDTHDLRLPWGAVSKTSGAGRRDPRAPAAACRPGAQVQTPAIAKTRPHLLGLAVSALGWLAFRAGDRPARHGRAMASGWLSFVLAVEVEGRQGGAPQDRS